MFSLFAPWSGMEKWIYSSIALDLKHSLHKYLPGHNLMPNATNTITIQKKTHRNSRNSNILECTTTSFSMSFDLLAL
jgi:hypothetical protein